MKVWEGKQVVVSYYLQQQQEDDIEEGERNETLHQTKLSSIQFSRSVTLVPNRILLKWRPSKKKKSEAQPLS